MSSNRKRSVFIPRKTDKLKNIDNKNKSDKNLIEIKNSKEPAYLMIEPYYHSQIINTNSGGNINVNYIITIR
jgi:hypothetical protein